MLIRLFKGGSGGTLCSLLENYQGLNWHIEGGLDAFWVAVSMAEGALSLLAACTKASVYASFAVEDSRAL